MRKVKGGRQRQRDTEFLVRGKEFSSMAESGRWGFAIILDWKDQRQRRIRSHVQKFEHVKLEMSYDYQHLLCIKSTSL